MTTKPNRLEKALFILGAAMILTGDAINIMQDNISQFNSTFYETHIPGYAMVATSLISLYIRQRKTKSK